MISKAKIEEVLSRANIIDFVQERVNIKRAGSNYKAICPFHDEKTPSMMISEAKQIFKCFGCGAGGNVINFIMQYEALTYPEAIRFVAEKVGVEIIEEEISDENQEILNKLDQRREELYSILNKATTFFHYNLLDELEEGSNDLLLSYLKKRNITSRVIEEFKLGYAPDSWNDLLNNQNFKDCSTELLIEAGLIKKSDKGKFFDFFRNRLVFPVFDSFGNTIAFSARVLIPEDIPKYLNSPDSVVYKKNSVLFGFYHAKEAIRKQKKAILVEGNLDQISLFKFGFENTIATCGTAYTDEHARILKRNSDQLLICLDSDTAGYKASLKAVNTSLKAGLDVRLVNLPKGEDPDSFLENKGAEEFQELLNNSLEFIDFYLAHNNVSNVQNKILVAKNVLTSIYQISDEIKREVYLNDLSEKLKLSVSVLKEQLKLQKSNERKPARRQEQEEKIEEKKSFVYNSEEEVEFSIIYLMLSNEKAFNEFKEKITHEYFFNKYCFKLYTIITKKNFSEISLAEIIIGFPPLFSDFFTRYAVKNDHFYQNPENDYEKKIEEAVNQNFIAISRLYYKNKKTILTKEIAKAESENDSALADRLFLEVNKISNLEKNLN